MFERLEQRIQLTLVPNSEGIITINGSDNAQSWEVNETDGVLTWKDLVSGATDSTAGPYSGLRVNLFGGNDLLRLRTRYDTRFILVPTTLSGGVGNDTIIAGEGRDSVVGEAGDDRLDGRGGRDTLTGGVGFDTADYSSRVDFLRITLDGVNNDGGTYGESDNVLTENVLGGTLADQIFGDAGANLIDGGAGNDTIVGGAGNDTLTGGLGIDQLFGQEGNDFLFAREGLVDQISDGPDADSASVDSVAVGDLVTDVANAAAPPSPTAGAISLAAAPLTSARGGGADFVATSAPLDNDDDGCEYGCDEDHDCDVEESDEEPLIAENLLTPDAVQGLAFTFLDEETGVIKPVPQDLVDRLRFALSADGTLTINGTDGYDDISVAVDAAAGLLTVTHNGSLRAFPLAAVTAIVLNGLGSGDILFADESVTVPVTFNGGDGDDTVHGGGADDTLNGEAGDDVLVAGAGDDVLAGAAGRDFLIGGDGADALDGGSDDDVLIPGATAYDDDLDALTLLQDDWTDRGRAYTNRVADLNGGGPGSGVNGRTYLRPGNSSSKTVFDDADRDVLTGGDGQDYFFLRDKGPNADVVTDAAKSEKTAKL